MSMTARFTGNLQLSNKLKRLAKPSVARRIARKAGRESMKLVRDAAKQNAKSIDDPATREKIWRNITIQTAKSSQNEVKIRVGIRGGAKGFAAASGEIQGAGKDNPGGATFYWRFLEFGTSEMAAKPFMRPALTSNTGAVTTKFAEVFSPELDKELAKL
ncbi:HK97-gp10 family putative phage morphogenesis protein [Acinetobacter sp. ANC 4639]